jgi:multidrug resistance efflux pump
MEKLIFFGLVIPILFFVLYLGTRAVMSGVSAKQANRDNKDEQEIDDNAEESNTDKSLSNELEKLNALRESGVLTQEEFEKAKNKLLNN